MPILNKKNAKEKNSFWDENYKNYKDQLNLFSMSFIYKFQYLLSPTEFLFVDTSSYSFCILFGQDEYENDSYIVSHEK